MPPKIPSVKEYAAQVRDLRARRAELSENPTPEQLEKIRQEAAEFYTWKWKNQVLLYGESTNED